MIPTDPGRQGEKARPDRGRATSDRSRTLRWRVVTWGGLCLLCVLSLLPGNRDLDVDVAKDFHHFAAYLVLGIAAGATYPTSRLGWALALSFVAGGLELLQHFSPGREASWNDFLSSTAGALVGLSIPWAWQSLSARGAVDPRGDRLG